MPPLAPGMHFGALVSLPVAVEPLVAYTQTTVLLVPSLAIATEPLSAWARMLLKLDASAMTLLPCDAWALTLLPLVACA